MTWRRAPYPGGTVKTTGLRPVRTFLSGRSALYLIITAERGLRHAFWHKVSSDSRGFNDCGLAKAAEIEHMSTRNSAATKDPCDVDWHLVRHPRPSRADQGGRRDPCERGGRSALPLR